MTVECGLYKDIPDDVEMIEEVWHSYDAPQVFKFFFENFNKYPEDSDGDCEIIIVSDIPTQEIINKITILFIENSEQVHKEEKHFKQIIEIFKNKKDTDVIRFNAWL